MSRFAATAVIVAAACAAANAQTTYNTSVNPGWFVGTGQPNANFVVNDNPATGTQTGLSSFYRFDGGQNSIANNVYEFNSGNTYAPAGTAAWNFNFHANLGGNGNLINNVILLTIDWDPTAGQDLRTYHLEGLFLIASGNPNLNLLQGSENLGFSYWSDPNFLTITGSQAPSVAFDPNATGTYTFNLAVYTLDGGQLSSVDMAVNVVPAPALRQSRAWAASRRCVAVAAEIARIPPPER
ncbi:MAG: hypothetical protein QM783_17690 [Phycisphaerales bacterium]